MSSGIDLAVWTLAQGLGGPRGGGQGVAATGGGGDALMLVSWWKPLLILIPFLAWAWVVATIYDKDAQRFYLKRRRWNMIHLLAGVSAIALAAMLPSLFIGFPAMVVLLATDLAIYAMVHNRCQQVREEQRWSLNFEQMKARREQRAKVKLAKNVTLSFRGPSGEVAPPEKDTPEYEVRVAAETMLIDAVAARASRFDLTPVSESAYSFGIIIDGVRQSAETLPAARAIDVIDFFKNASGLDVSDRRRKLRADLEMEQAGAVRTLRITSWGGSSGVRMNIIFDPQDQVRISLDDLGLLPAQRQELDAIIQERQGAVIIATPPQGGRTTSLYALIRAHDAYTSNVQSIELEPQDHIEGVKHNIFDPNEDGAEYSTTVRSILRRDPDVVAIAELPDSNTAIEITRADHERTRTYIGLRADGALPAIQTFLKAANKPEAVAQALHGVIAQRLVRKLCLNCRIEYEPSPELIKKLGAKPGAIKKLYKKGGQVLIKNKPEVCPVCSGTGYFGQDGVFEVFRIGDDERPLIAAKDLIGLRSALRKKRLPSIQEVAIHKAASGVTSVEEVVRVTSGAKSKKKSTSKKPQPTTT